MSPAISVIIPNYNHARFLKQRIESVLNQSFSDFECIILDDASTDDSRDTIISFEKSDERICFYPSDVNSGNTFTQWNKGVRLAKNEYIWIAESDDAADPDLLMVLKSELDKDPQTVLAYCQSNRMDEEGKVTGSWKTFTHDIGQELFANNFTMNGQEFIERFLIHKNVIPNASAVLFRKSFFVNAGCASEFLKTNGDWLIWLKMLCAGNVAFIAKPMNYFRYHPSSVIAKNNIDTNRLLYKEQYDCTMRRAFKHFLKDKNMRLSKKVKKINDYFMSLDIGNKGLFELKNGKFIKGWLNIMAASCYPRISSGFIKKGLSRI